MSAAGMVQDWADLQRQVTILTAQCDELVAALTEIAKMDTQYGHTATSAREVARAALSKVQSGGGGV